jgi:hypothetical protein
MPTLTLRAILAAALAATLLLIISDIVLAQPKPAPLMGRIRGCVWYKTQPVIAQKTRSGGCAAAERNPSPSVERSRGAFPKPANRRSSSSRNGCPKADIPLPGLVLLLMQMASATIPDSRGNGHG